MNAEGAGDVSALMRMNVPIQSHISHFLGTFASQVCFWNSSLSTKKSTFTSIFVGCVLNSSLWINLRVSALKPHTSSVCMRLCPYPPPYSLLSPPLLVIVVQLLCFLRGHGNFLGLLHANWLFLEKICCNCQNSSTWVRLTSKHSLHNLICIDSKSGFASKKFT